MPPVKPFSKNCAKHSKRKRAQQLAEARKKRKVKGGPGKLQNECVSAESSSSGAPVKPTSVDSSVHETENQSSTSVSKSGSSFGTDMPQNTLSEKRQYGLRSLDSKASSRLTKISMDAQI